VSGYLFPSKRNPSGHVPGDLLGEWLREAERRAKLPKLAGVHLATLKQVPSTMTRRQSEDVPQHCTENIED
jgi:hypothetical protein